MRFSILLPIRNGAKFLAGCIESVLNQRYPESGMELVLSDNASIDETPHAVQPYLNDPRVKYQRLPEFVPVTENWSNALAMSSGEYTLMLGDDDALLPQCLERLEGTLQRYRFPECVTFNGYLYVAPHSIYENPYAYYKDPYHHFFDHLPDGGILSREDRMSIVTKMFDFIHHYPLNMQLTLFSRALAGRVRGGIFQPPFPDHYGLNALLIESNSLVVIPDQLVVIGVSPKSFGHYYFSNEHEQGMQVLGTTTAFTGKLSGGNEILNAMYQWLLLLKKNYPDILGDVRINHRRYQALQLDHWLSLYVIKALSLRQVRELSSSVSLPLSAWMRWFARFAIGSLRRYRRQLHGKARSSSTIEDVLPIRPLPHIFTMTQFLGYLHGQQEHGPCILPW